MPADHFLQIVAVGDTPHLSAQQKRFNARVGQIEQARLKRLDWETGTATYRQAHWEFLRPLQDELVAGQRQWALALDAVLDSKGWSKADRETLTDLLLQAAGELLKAGANDEALKSLFDKHSDTGFEATQRENALSMKDVAEAMMGLDLGDDDLESDEVPFQRLHHELRQHEEAQESARASKSSPGRKTAAQRRREGEDRQATQSVREAYRKLAGALHPDREPDLAQRDAKIAMMEGVNQAYEANDLLAVLELQLQIEQIDASHIANAGEERLKYHNKVLGEQLDELRAELERVEMSFCAEFSLRPAAPLSPRKLGELFQPARRAW